MFSDHATLTYTVLGLFSVSAVAFLLSQPTDFAKWVQKKKYQYEVTFALYMLTPTEKFVFNSILFLFVSMLGIAAALYLPDHITIIARRSFYYWAGDASLGNSSYKAADTIWQTAARATDAVVDAVSGLKGAAASASAQEVAQVVAEGIPAQ
ncbi:hypothetical protein WHR41_08474 [Cladosporium halotolerans]|uniref:Uncharacterized protein n=1 Tax=Cladosporium halotolerans TaxID=1052096 RepID=A0AB34KGY0_9PEZI